MLDQLRCNQVTRRLWVQHGWKGVWICAFLTFSKKPQWPWECILKAANLGQILWSIFGRNRNPRRLSYLLKLHSHLAVQQRHTQASLLTQFSNSCYYFWWKRESTMIMDSCVTVKKTLKTLRCSYTVWPESVIFKCLSEKLCTLEINFSESTIAWDSVRGYVYLCEELEAGLAGDPEEGRFPSFSPHTLLEVKPELHCSKKILHTRGLKPYLVTHFTSSCSLTDSHKSHPDPHSFMSRHWKG